MPTTELLKLLLEQPSKFGLICLNLLRLLLTVMILNSFPNLFKYNFPKNFLTFDENLHIGFLFLYIMMLAVVWIVVWEAFESLFSLLITIKKSKAKDEKDDELKEERRTIGSYLKRFNVVTIENKDFLIPQKRIHDVDDFLEFVDENDTLNVAKSSFAKVLYLVVVAWLYTLFNFSYIGIPICGHVVIGGFILLLYFIFKALDKLIIAVDDHSDDLRIELDGLEFRKLVMDTILQDFRGRINIDNKSFDFNWGRNGYKLFDYYHYHEGLGNAYLLKKMRSAKQKKIEGEIIVLNFNPNETLKRVFEAKKLGGFVVANEHKELLDNLTTKLNELEAIKTAETSSKQT